MWSSSGCHPPPAIFKFFQLGQKFHCFSVFPIWCLSFPQLVKQRWQHHAAGGDRECEGQIGPYNEGLQKELPNSATCRAIGILTKMNRCLWLSA